MSQGVDTQILAVLLMWVPMLDTTEPAHSRAKNGQRRADGHRPGLKRDGRVPDCSIGHLPVSSPAGRLHRLVSG